MALNDKNSRRTKRIDVRYHYVKDKVSSGEIQLLYCPTAEMIADVLTKSVPAAVFSRLSRTLMRTPLEVDSACSAGRECWDVQPPSEHGNGRVLHMGAHDQQRVSSE